MVRSKFLDKLFDIPFEELFVMLEDKLQDHDLSQGSIFLDIAENPYYLSIAGKLAGMASREYETMKIEHKIHMANLREKIIKGLEHKKGQKLITRQVTKDFVDQALLVNYPDEILQWDKNLADCRELRDITKILYEAFQARVMGTQSINKKLFEYSEKRKRQPFRR